MWRPPLSRLGQTHAGPPPLEVFKAINKSIPVDALLLYRRRVEDLRRTKAEIERQLAHSSWLDTEIKNIRDIGQVERPSSPSPAEGVDSLLRGKLLSLLKGTVNEMLRSREVGLLLSEQQCHDMGECQRKLTSSLHLFEVCEAASQLLALAVGSLRRSLEECRKDLNWIANDDPATSVAVWFGQGGRRRPIGTGWLDRWSLPLVWLEERVREVCQFADPLLLRWIISKESAGENEVSDADGDLKRLLHDSGLTIGKQPDSACRTSCRSHLRRLVIS